MQIVPVRTAEVTRRAELNPVPVILAIKKRLSNFPEASGFPVTPGNHGRRTPPAHLPGAPHAAPRSPRTWRSPGREKRRSVLPARPAQAAPAALPSRGPGSSLTVASLTPLLVLIRISRHLPQQGSCHLFRSGVHTTKRVESKLRNQVLESSEKSN